MTEYEKIINGKIYIPTAENLPKLRIAAHTLSEKYNRTDETKTKRREKILDKLVPNRKSGAFLQGPVHFDYGIHTYLGKNFYANFNFTVLDVSPVYIGDNVMIGPNCSVMTAVHPLRYQDRNLRELPDGSLTDIEYSKPITIGDNCWIAANVTICDGVKIGNGCVIGAGSVVTRDIPDNSLAVGNPCRVLRQITEDDAIELKKDLFV